MLLWNTIHFAGLGLQIAAGITGIGYLNTWIQTKNGHAEINVERLSSVKKIGKIALWMFAIGALLLLFYEIYLLQN